MTSFQFKPNPIEALILNPTRSAPPRRNLTFRCSAASVTRRSYSITLIPGDGIGPEVVSVAKDVLSLAASREGIEFKFREMPVGGAALDATGMPLPEETLAAAKESDAVLLGAIGGYKWDENEKNLKPETGLLQLRAGLGVFANLRPATVLPQLVDSSTLKREVAEGVDIMVVRELTGGIYFGKPRGFGTNEKGEDIGFNTEVYSSSEIDRITRVAFEVARKRHGKLCSVDKANVLEASMLWRKRVMAIAAEFSDVQLSHMYVDNAAMQLIRDPKQFDTIVTNNIFGDILSDEASMLTGSIGMLPSASVGESGPGLFEPIHGSAPDIAGQDKANPLATVLSAAMLLRYGLGEDNAAKRIEAAVIETLNRGFRTGDIFSSGTMETPSINAGLNLTLMVLGKVMDLGRVRGSSLTRLSDTKVVAAAAIPILDSEVNHIELLVAWNALSWSYRKFGPSLVWLRYQCTVYEDVIFLVSCLIKKIKLT